MWRLKTLLFSLGMKWPMVHTLMLVMSWCEEPGRHVVSEVCVWLQRCVYASVWRELGVLLRHIRGLLFWQVLRICHSVPWERCGEKIVMVTLAGSVCSRWRMAIHTQIGPIRTWRPQTWSDRRRVSRGSLMVGVREDLSDEINL